MRTIEIFIDPKTKKKYKPLKTKNTTRITAYKRRVRGWYKNIDLIKIEKGIYCPININPDEKQK